MSKLHIAKQWMETDQMTSMATQWSHSTPWMSPITQEQVGQCQNSIGYAAAPGLCPLQIGSNGRFSQPVPCCNSSLT